MRHRSESQTIRFAASEWIGPNQFSQADSIGGGTPSGANGFAGAVGSPRGRAAGTPSAAVPPAVFAGPDRSYPAAALTSARVDPPTTPSALSATSPLPSPPL